MKTNVLPTLHQRIEVAWADCYTVDAWTGVDALLLKKMPTIKSVGFFLGVTLDKCWVVTSGLIVTEGETSGGATWFIPKKMIQGWGAA